MESSKKSLHDKTCDEYYIYNLTNQLSSIKVNMSTILYHTQCCKEFCIKYNTDKKYCGLCCLKIDDRLRIGHINRLEGDVPIMFYHSSCVEKNYNSCSNRCIVCDKDSNGKGRFLSTYNQYWIMFKKFLIMVFAALSLTKYVMAFRKSIPLVELNLIYFYAIPIMLNSTCWIILDKLTYYGLTVCKSYLHTFYIRSQFCTNIIIPLICIVGSFIQTIPNDTYFDQYVMYNIITTLCFMIGYGCPSCMICIMFTFLWKDIKKLIKKKLI